MHELHMTSALGTDLFPTFVTASMVATELERVDSLVNFAEDEYVRALGQHAITVDDFDAWKSFATRWRAFYSYQTSRTFMFDAKSVLAETELYDQERYLLRRFLSQKAPDFVRGPEEAPPGTPGGNSIDWDRVIAWGGAVAIVGTLAYLFGPAIRSYTAKLVNR